MNNKKDLEPFELILPIWAGRKQILVTSFIFALVGGIFGYLSPVTYTANSTFLPQTSQAGSGAGGFGGLAALAGINLNAPMAVGDIPPSMYATVLASEPFRKRILDAKIWVDGDTLTYRSYLENQPGSALGTIQEYTIGLPEKLIGFLSSSKEENIVGAEIGLQPLSNKEYSLLNSISGKVSIINDKKEGIITISVVESDPIIAAQITKVTEGVLQDWISEHKMKNAKAQYDFIVKQFEAKQKEIFAIQDQLAGYMDSNQNVLSASYLTRLQRMQAEFDLVNNVYSELAKQKEQAAIQLSKDMPTFSVLDPVKIPRERTGPKKSLYVLGAFIMGLITSSGWFLVKNSLYEFFKVLKNNALT